MIAQAVILPPMPRKPLPEIEKKVGISARVTPRVLQALQALADADDRKLSYIVEKILREHVEKHTGKKPQRH